MKALWAFIGSGLAASATILAALLTKSHNDRALTLAAQDSERLKLDTAVSSISLIQQEDRYSPKAVVAGGLATLVHLGHPLIAMRVLSAASSDEAVDIRTTCWLIGHALTVKPGDDSLGYLLKLEASNMLFRSAEQIAEASITPNNIIWPECLQAQWPKGLPEDAAGDCIGALLIFLTSHPKAWWESGDNTWTWVIYTLLEALSDASPAVRNMAARFALRLIDGVPSDHAIVGRTEKIPDERAKQKAITQLNTGDSFSTPNLESRVEAWLRGAPPATAPLSLSLPT